MKGSRSLDSLDYTQSELEFISSEHESLIANVSQVDTHSVNLNNLFPELQYHGSFVTTSNAMATEISTMHPSNPPKLDNDILALIPIPAVNYGEDRCVKNPDADGCLRLVK